MMIMKNRRHGGVLRPSVDWAVGEVSTDVAANPLSDCDAVPVDEAASGNQDDPGQEPFSGRMIRSKRFSATRGRTLVNQRDSTERSTRTHGSDCVEGVTAGSDFTHGLSNETNFLED